MIKKLTPIVLIGAALFMGGCIQELPDGRITDKFTRAEGANARNGVCKPGAKCETVYNLCTSKCEDVAKTDYDTFQVGQMFSQDAYNAGHGRSGTKNNQDPEAWPVVFEAANDDYSNKPFVVHVQYKCVPRMPNCQGGWVDYTKTVNGFDAWDEGVVVPFDVHPKEAVLTVTATGGQPVVCKLRKNSFYTYDENDSRGKKYAYCHAEGK
jgi:hypothetical protein